MNTERPSQGSSVRIVAINADVNGAKNILKRAVGYMLIGASVVKPAF